MMLPAWLPQLRLFGIPFYPFVGGYRVFPEELLRGIPSSCHRVRMQDLQSRLIYSGVDKKVFTKDVPEHIQHWSVYGGIRLRLLVREATRQPRDLRVYVSVPDLLKIVRVTLQAIRHSGQRKSLQMAEAAT